LNGRQLVLSPSYGEDAAAFLRSITFPAEDLPLFTVAPPCGGFRWFRSPNIVPMEKYQRPGLEDCLRAVRKNP
jgi:hypothetical protein